MKRAATHFFKRQSKNRTFFKIIKLLFRFKTPRGRPPGKTEERKPDTQGQLECANPGDRPGGWSGLELTDT